MLVAHVQARNRAVEYWRFCLIPTEAEGRREAYQGFSNASPDSAVTTHV